MKFDAYQLAKSDCVAQMKLPDLLLQATAQDAEQAAV
jgi:hypothetical protein